MKKILMICVVILAFLVVGLVVGYKVGKGDAPEPEVKVITKTVDREVEVEKKVDVTNEFVEEKLSNIGELATLDVQYMGIIRIEDSEGVSYINKVGYSMLYTVDARIGIQFDDIKVAVSDDAVTVTIPDAEVLSRHADGTTLQFFDEKWALFKSNELNDVPAAIALAEENFDEQSEQIESYLTTAKSRAELAVRSLLEGAIGEKELIIK